MNIWPEPIKAIKKYEENRKKVLYIKSQLERFSAINKVGKWGSGSYDLDITGINKKTIKRLCIGFWLKNRGFIVLIISLDNRIEVHNSNKTADSSRMGRPFHITEVSKLNPIDFLVVAVWAFFRTMLRFAVVGFFAGLAVLACWSLNFPWFLFDRF
jgi:hypothetical protein